MNKKHLFISIFCLVGFLPLWAGISTYTFTSLNWKSSINATTCDGKTDGFVCDKAATEYNSGRIDAKGNLYSCGVGVKTGTSGAGATSVKSFTEVRMLTFNFCQNSSKGKGIIYVQVGSAPIDSIVVTAPKQSGAGVYNRDSTIRLSNSPSGKIRFWVKCSENAIYLNTLTIRHKDGGSSPFTVDSYNLVTDVEELQDSDQIIIGVHQSNKDYVMGYFDVSVSKNNIHAIPAKYSNDRTQVAPNNSAIYTLHKTELEGETAYIIQDELRYDSAYLVASGGQTKNRLALWDKLTDPDTYGNYGYWDISISTDGQATIKNLGRSKGKYLQYNAQNNPTLFGCYAELSQTPVCIYRCTKALGDTTAIIVPLCNFGTQLMETGSVTGEKKLMVNANGLTQDIQVSLKHGAPFSLNTNTLDRDGDYLMVSFSTQTPGTYHDTIVFESGKVKTESVVLLRVCEPMSVHQAVMVGDFEQVWLKDVVVTKKFDTYIFVRDSTGSMLIYDNGDGEGHRYGSGLENGHVLHQVSGRMRNYFGVPELIPVQAWSVAAQKQICLPDSLTTQPDSSDVCRYVRIGHAVIDEYFQTTAPCFTQAVPASDEFDTGLIQNVSTLLDAIVMISWDVLQLWCVKQTPMVTATPCVLSPNDEQGKYIQNGRLFIRKAGHLYGAQGERLY